MCGGHGICVNNKRNYTCLCENGWQGFQCDENINECLSNPCKNNGTCVDKINGYICSCSENWEGESCQKDVNECRYMWIIRNLCE